MSKGKSPRNRNNWSRRQLPCKVAAGEGLLSFKELPFITVDTVKDQTIRNLFEVVARVTGLGSYIFGDTSMPDGTPKKQLDVSQSSCFGWFASINWSASPAITVEYFREEPSQKRLRL